MHALIAAEELRCQKVEEDCKERLAEVTRAAGLELAKAQKARADAEHARVLLQVGRLDVTRLDGLILINHFFEMQNSGRELAAKLQSAQNKVESATRENRNLYTALRASTDMQDLLPRIADFDPKAVEPWQVGHAGTRF